MIPTEQIPELLNTLLNLMLLVLTRQLLSELRRHNGGR